jgi:hypothetical protein
VSADGPDEDAPAEHYFTPRPRSPSARSQLRFLYRGEILSFAVDRGVFASHGLDPGTALLIENLGVERKDRVLDLGCGWGPVGVAAARSAPEGRVVLTEVNRRAARLARDNLERNRVTNAEVRIGPLFEPVGDERFDVVATNPPYRAGRPRDTSRRAAASCSSARGRRGFTTTKTGSGSAGPAGWTYSGGVRATGCSRPDGTGRDASSRVRSDAAGTAQSFDG